MGLISEGYSNVLELAVGAVAKKDPLRTGTNTSADPCPLRAGSSSMSFIHRRDHSLSSSRPSA